MKNPVDHPMGGGEGRFFLEVIQDSRKGLLAKGKKT